MAPRFIGALPRTLGALGRAALDTTESRALLAEAEAAGVVHAVNFEFRHDPARVKVRELIAGGAVGVPQQFWWTHTSDAWRRRRVSKACSSWFAANRESNWPSVSCACVSASLHSP